MPDTPELWRDLGQNNTAEGTPTIFFGDQNEPKVIHLSNGNILVAWVSNQTTGAGSPNGTDIIGRIYDPLGNPITGEIRLNTSIQADNERDFDLAATANGGFVMVYVDADDPNSTETDIYVSEYNSDGIQQSNELVANDGIDDQTYRNPNIAIQGNVAVITYEEDPAIDNDIIVQSVTYTLSSNTIGTENTIFNGNSGAGEGINGSNITALSNNGVANGFAVVFGNNNPAPTDDIIQVQLFDNNGNETGTIINVSNSGDFNSDPHIVGLVDGGFVVVWEIDGTDNSGNSGPRYRVFNSDGTPQTGVLAAATTTAGNQSQVVVAALSDGGFVVAWVDENTDDIHGQRFNSAGATVGNEFNIDTNIGPLASNFDIEGMDDGRFVVTWTESVQTGTTGAPFNFPLFDTDIRSAIYDPRDDANSPNEYDGDIVIGTVGSDIIDVVSSDDEVYGFNGGDTFQFMGQVGHSNDIYDGGQGTDRLLFNGAATNNLQTADLLSIEEIEFGAASNEDKTLIFDATQFGGAGISSTALIDGNANGAGAVDTLRINMNMDTFVNLSDLNFTGWDNGIDIIEINGDGDNESIIGTTQNDIISTAGGNDFIEGGLGADMIDGGIGTDTASYLNSAVGVTVFTSGRSGRNGDAQGDQLTDIENIFGSNMQDQIVLNADSAVDNTVFAGNGDDRIRERDGGTNELNGGNGDDNIFGGTGNDTLNGDNNEDNLFGGAGNDNLDGGSDLERDVLFGGSDDDLLVGRGGNDALRGNTGEDRLFGGTGNDNLQGGNQNDELDGGNGVDVLDGGSGNDILNGGSGNDRLTGGGSNDLFIFENGSGIDRITDSNFGSGDQIDLTSFGLADFAAVMDLATQVGDDVRIQLNMDDRLILQDTTLASLDANDFILV